MNYYKIIPQIIFNNKSIFFVDDLIEKQQSDRENILLKIISQNTKILSISDNNTYQILAKNLNHILQKNYEIHNLILDNPKPEKEYLDEIFLNIKNTQFIIAVGSGTINDIAKYLAHKININYVVFPTAPSMNGYISATASIIQKKSKESLATIIPKAVIVDWKTIIQSPLRLIKSGIADVLCRTTCEADWILADCLKNFVNNNNYQKSIYDQIRQLEKQLIQNAKKILDKEPQVIKLLMYLILASGLIMTQAKGSMPYSQGEHLQAHYLEACEERYFIKLLHGEQIAYTTATLTKIQDEILKQNVENLMLDNKINHRSLEKIVDKLQNYSQNHCQTYPHLQKMIQQKYQNIFVDVIQFNSNLKQNWLKYKQDIINSRLKTQELLYLYDELNIKYKVEENSNVDMNIYQESILLCPLLRNRFGFYDMKLLLTDV